MANKEKTGGNVDTHPNRQSVTLRVRALRYFREDRRVRILTSISKRHVNEINFCSGSSYLETCRDRGMKASHRRTCGNGRAQMTLGRSTASLPRCTLPWCASPSAKCAPTQKPASGAHYARSRPNWRRLARRSQRPVRPAQWKRLGPMSRQPYSAKSVRTMLGQRLPNDKD